AIQPVADSCESVAVVTGCLPLNLFCLFPISVSPPFSALCLTDIPSVVVSLSSPASLLGGIAQIWPDLLLMEDNCALMVVLRSSSIPPASLVSKTGFLVLGWRALVPEISTSDSSLFFITNEKLMYQESILGLKRAPWRLPSSSFPVTASVASISAVRVLVIWFLPCGVSSFIVQGLVEVVVYPNKSGCGIDVGVLVVPVRVLREGGAEVAVCGDWCLGLRQALVRPFRRFGAAPLSSAASSDFEVIVKM
ncbi:LOW QUALITY PROTEIN: hypothetical protein HID58_071967, partial [Brassica napus]